MIVDKCATCKHNLDKAKFDCEYGAACATQAKTDNDGIARIVKCDDYEPD